jgi:DNA-binding NarL/FixJ family response regulator
MDDRRSIAILSDQTLFRQGLTELLRGHGFHRVAEFASSSALLAAARDCPPEVLLVDLDHEQEDTMMLVRALRHQLVGTHLVVIGSAQRQGAADGATDGEVETPHGDDRAVLAAVEASRARHPSAAVRRQHHLWKRITPRQRDVMRWLATGSDNRTIARKLRVGERAVKAHVSSLLALFEVDNRTRLALLADRAGLRPPSVRRA